MILRGWRLDVAMHSPNQFRRTCMQLSVVAEAIQTGIAELRGRSAEACGVRRYGVPQQIVERFAAERAAGIFEELIAHSCIQADGFEYLAVPITAHGGDAHAR